MSASFFGMAAGVLSFIDFGIYIASILRGKTRPNRATWIILTVVGMILAASYYASGARDTMWVPVSYVIGPLIVALLSIKHGEGGWSRLDRFSLFGAAASLVLWMLSGVALTALLINVFIDFLGMIPTMYKSYERPGSESLLAWFMTFLASVLNIFAIGQWNLSVAIYPVYLLLASGIVTGLLLRKRLGGLLGLSGV